MLKIAAISLAIFSMAVLAFCAPAQAEDEQRALHEAQKFEAEGQYALAASAYLAVAEDFDFLPGTLPTEKLTNEQKVIVGKCAINCLERGIHQYLSKPDHVSLSYCPEFLLMASTCDAMMKLEPHNMTWNRLHSEIQVLLATHN